jgi:N-acetylglutamate synthase-like GNAT family acetyltransferase
MTFGSHDKTSIDPTDPLGSLEIRTYREADQSAALDLLKNGMLSEHIDPFEQDKVRKIRTTYPQRPGDHFWVATVNGPVIGMIAIAEDDRKVAHIRRLRVAPAWQQTAVAYRLVKTAVEHATESGALKIVLHTPLDAQRAKDVLGHLGFIFAGSKTLNDHRLLEFYLDLYFRADPQESSHQEQGWRLT